MTSGATETSARLLTTETVASRRSRASGPSRGEKTIGWWPRARRAVARSHTYSSDPDRPDSVKLVIRTRRDMRPRVRGRQPDPPFTPGAANPATRSPEPGQSGQTVTIRWRAAGG